MELWQLPAQELWDRLNALSQEPPPDDPHQQLLVQSFLKHAPAECLETSYTQALLQGRPFSALWAEMRCLGPQTPLKHRDFVPQLQQLARHNRERPALQALSSQAQLGDVDALFALIRASLECGQDLYDCLCQSLETIRINPDVWERFLKLYEDSPEFSERISSFRQTFLAEVPAVDLTRLEIPLPARPPRPAPQPSSLTPQWSLRQLKGLGRLTLFSKPPKVFDIGMETVRCLPRGFLYTSYKAANFDYMGSGDSRRIHATRLADDLSYLVLQCAGGTWDLLSLKGKVLASIPEGPWSCYTTCQTSKLPLIGGPHGIYRVEHHNLILVDKRPVHAFCHHQEKLLTLDSEGVLRQNNRRKGKLPPGPPAHFSPDGHYLARLHAGQLEIFQHQSPYATFPAPKEREFNFSADSQSLVTIGPDDLTHWSLDGTPLAHYTEREATGQPLPIHPPPTRRTNLQELARHDRFFEDLRGWE